MEQILLVNATVEFVPFFVYVTFINVHHITSYV